MLARDGWDDFAHLFGGVWLQAVAALDAGGEPSFPRVHGREFWAWLGAHPDASERLVMLDGVIEPGNAPDGAKWLDLLMLVIAGGRERTAEQWQALLNATGWRATRISHGVVEAEPA